ncbi:hypothetical protein RvY_18513 [Ramazzottius varieornatus]|uniref:Uncharacterized protein n=1 Tax=Ramazzottius varieornatus TaxID=947166 RepID=A0A1D1W633_RAMVA|nr:hypothetical protein RvY_18513 [Ramazzottius varieornatus]
MTEKVEEEFGKALKARCATRWNSNFIMAEHALQLDWDKLTNMIASGECMLLEKYSLELLALLEERFDKLEDVFGCCVSGSHD